MSKNPINTNSNQISNLSQIQSDLATHSTLAETRYLRSEEQVKEVKTAQEKIDAIQLAIESRGNAAKVAGSIMGNLGKVVNYFFGNPAQTKKTEEETKKVEQDLQDQKIGEVFDKLVAKKREIGSLREFYVSHKSGFYYKKPMMSLDNSELREKFKQQQSIIDAKGNSTTTEEFSRYAESLLNLNLNLRGCGQINHPSKNSVSSVGNFFHKKIKELADLTEKTFADLEKFNQTANSQFQLGFFALSNNKAGKAAQYFSKALELKKADFATLGEEEQKSHQSDMKWFNHFAAIFSQPQKAIELLQEEIRINPNHQSYEHLARIYGKEGKIDDAILCIKKGLEINPEAKKLNLEIAKFLMKQNKPEEALIHLDREIEISKQSHDLHALRDAVFFRVEYENGVENYDKSIEFLNLLALQANKLKTVFISSDFDTTIPRAHINLKKSELEEKIGNPQKAKEYKELAIKGLDNCVTNYDPSRRLPELHNIETLAKLEIERDGFEEARFKNKKVIEKQLELLRIVKENNNKIPLDNGGGFRVHYLHSVYRKLSLLFFKECELILEQTKQNSIDQKTKETLQQEGLAILDSVKEIFSNAAIETSGYLVGNLVGHKIKHIHQELTKTFTAKLKENTSNQPSTSPKILSDKHSSLQSREMTQKTV